MRKQKTRSSIIWFSGERLDARIAIVMCLSMIAKALKAIAKEGKNAKI